MFQQSIIKEIYEKTDIVELISKTVHLEKQDSFWQGLCPFHKERSPSFFVDPTQKRYHCYGCGSGGNIFSYVMQRDKCSFEKAVATLAVRAGIAIPENRRDLAYEKKKRRMIEMNAAASEFFYQKGQSDAQTLQYLKDKRGLTAETIKKFGLGRSGSFGQELFRYLKSKGFTKEEMMEGELLGYGERYENGKKTMGHYDRFWDRVMFPIFNANHQIIAFGGRVFGDGSPKYLNSPETAVFDKSHELYGLSFAKEEKKSFVLCEGYLDVISMHQAGFTTAVASLGTSLTFAQAKIIKKYSDTVFIAYDSDAAGIKATVRAIPMLEGAGLKVYVATTAPYKDVDELLRSESGVQEMKRRFKDAVPGKQFLIQHLDSADKDYYGKVVDLLMKGC